MNLSRVFRKISDVAADAQTDKLKGEVYSMILSFVRKYQKHYFPHSKDDPEDVASDLYLKFVTPKLHRNGETFSELDRFDPNATGEYSGSKLATYLKTFVTSRLIDLERTDKQEAHYSEKYNPDEGSEASLDYLAKAVEAAQDHDFNPDEFEASPDLILAARDAFDNLSYEEQQDFIAEYNEAKSALNKEFQKVFEDVIAGAKTSSDNPVLAAVDQVFGHQKVDEQSTRKGSALRITFSDKDAALAAKPKIKQLNDLLEPQGYNFYTLRGNAIYYLKSE